MITNKSRLRIISTLFFLLFSQYTLSQNAIEEILVIAQKREQGIQEIGVAVSAYTSEKIKKLGLTKNIDIAAQTPGLIFSEGSEQLISITNIRGVSQNDVSFHLEPPNAVYLDQAYISVLSASNFQMFDMNRVEVVRGPQGTLYGRNATGGVLHYISNSPTEELESYVDVQSGENSQFRLEGAVSGSLTENLEGRLSGLSDSYDGYARNTTIGSSFRGRDESAVRGQLEFTPTEDLSIRLIGFAGDQSTELGYKHSANGFDADGLSISLDRDTNFWGNCAGCDPSGFRDTSDDPYLSDFDTPGFFESETSSISSIIDWSVNDLDVTSVTNYLDYEASHREDGELSSRPGFDLNSSQDSNQFSQEFRISQTTADQFWLVGVFYMDREAKASEDVNVGLPYLDDVLTTLGQAPAGLISSFGNSDTLLSNWELNTSSWAVFGQLEVDITHSLTLISGLRYTDDRHKYNFNSVESIDGFPLGPGGILGETSAIRAKNEDELSGKIGIEWTPDSDILYYAKYSIGTKSGGFNAPFLGGIVTDFDGEKLEAFEIGLKTNLFQNRAKLNISAFTYDYTDYQGFTFVNLAPRILNLDAEINGVELEFFTTPLDDLDIGFGLSYLDTRILDVALPSARVTDREMPLAPQSSVNVFLNKEWQLSQGSVNLTLDYSWVDDHFSEALNNPSGLIPSYGVSNARLAYKTGDERWEIALQARNLADEEILYYRTPIGFGFNQDHYGRGKWITGQVIYRI